MEKKIVPYANAVSVAMSNDTGETVFSFLQGQPGYNPDDNGMTLEGNAEVASVIVPFDLLEKMLTLGASLADSYKKQKKTTE